MFGFDSKDPITKDMKMRGVEFILFEIVNKKIKK